MPCFCELKVEVCKENSQNIRAGSRIVLELPPLRKLDYGCQGQ